jgi:hypothetical protein
MRPGDRAVVLALRADKAARRVAKAADGLAVLDLTATGNAIVRRATWLALQYELAAWREATARVVQALDGAHGRQEGLAEIARGIAGPPRSR